MKIFLNLYFISLIQWNCQQFYIDLFRYTQKYIHKREWDELQTGVGRATNGSGTLYKREWEDLQTGVGLSTNGSGTIYKRTLKILIY